MNENNQQAKPCPYCKSDLVGIIAQSTNVSVRDEVIAVTEVYCKCRSCGEEYEYANGHDHLDEAYREYHKRHNMLQPEEIANWREQLNLSIQDATKVLGWSDENQLCYYEHGALQSIDHDNRLKSAINSSCHMRTLL